MRSTGGWSSGKQEGGDWLGRGEMDGSRAAPELERARGLQGRGTVCSTVSTGLPPTLSPHALYLCRSRGAVPEKGPDYHRHLRGSAGRGHRLRGRLLQDQVSCRALRATRDCFCGDRLSSPPHHAWPSLPHSYAPLPPSAAGEGPKGWAKKQEQRRG